MTKRGASGTSRTPAQLREERLKKALKANMGRRKAQARARTAERGVQAPGATDTKGPAEPQEDGS